MPDAFAGSLTPGPNDGWNGAHGWHGRWHGRWHWADAVVSAKQRSTGGGMGWWVKPWAAVAWVAVWEAVHGGMGRHGRRWHGRWRHGRCSHRSKPDAFKKVPCKRFVSNMAKPDPQPKMKYVIVHSNRTRRNPTVKVICQSALQRARGLKTGQAGDMELTGDGCRGTNSPRKNRSRAFTRNIPYFSQSELRSAMAVSPKSNRSRRTKTATETPPPVSESDSTDHRRL